MSSKECDVQGCCKLSMLVCTLYDKRIHFDQPLRLDHFSMKSLSISVTLINKFKGNGKQRAHLWTELKIFRTIFIKDTVYSENN